MCFKTKIKVPKTNADTLSAPAPNPVLLDSPTGVQFGSSDTNSTDGVDSVKIDKTSGSTVTGDGTQTAKAPDTGLSKLAKLPTMRALKKVTKG